MPLTLEERERIAYANGDVETAALLREAIDGDGSLMDQIVDLEAECEMLQAEVTDLSNEIESLRA